MANFNAGAIEGTLTLDRSPFDRDLKEAMAMARAFEKNKIKIPLEIVGEEAFTELEAKLQALRDESVNVKLDIDGEETLEALAVELDAIRDETVTIELDIDGLDKIAELEAELAAIPDETVTVEVDTDSGQSALRRLAGEKNSIRGITVAIGALIAILPAVVPVALGAAAAVGALVSATSILVAGMGAFALVAIPAWKQYTEAVKAAKGDLSKLTPQMAALRVEQERFQAAVSHGAEANRIYAVIGGTFRLLTTLIVKAKPLVDAVAIAFTHLLDKANAFAASPLFTKVISFLASQFEPTFMQVIGIVANLVKTIGGLTVAFAPFMHIFLGGLQDITAAWANWAASLSGSKKFTDFINYVKQTGPKLIEVVTSIGNALGNIGAALAPMGGGTLDAIIGFFNAIGDMNTSVLGAIIVGIGVLTVSIIAATVAMAAFDAVAAINPFVLIGMAIVALVAAFIYLWKTNEGFRNFFINTWNAIWGFMKAVGAWFAGPFAGFFVSLWNGLKTGLSAIGSFFSSIWSAIVSVVTAYVKLIVTIVTTYFNIWKFVITTVLNVVMGIWRAFWGVFGGVITAAAKLVVAIVKLYFTAMSAVISAIMYAVRAVISTVWNGIKSVVSSVVNNIKSTVSSAWNAIKSVTSTVWNGVKSVATSAINALKGPVSSAVNAIKGAVSTAWNAVKSATSTAWNALKGIVSSALGNVKSTVSSVVSAIKGIFSGAGSWLYDAGRNIIQGLLNGIESLINSVTSKLSALTAKIPKVKGPEEKDKKLLRPAGRFIMGGFIDELDKGIKESLDTLAGFTDKIPGTAELTQQLSMVPTTGPSAFPQPAPGMTKEDFTALVSQLIEEIRNSTQPLIGEFHASDKTPQEIAEEWWFISKGRG